MIAPQFANELLAPMHDGAIFSLGEGRVAFSTDSYVVSPIFFPGGDIGKLAVHGTVHDLAMCGAKPLYLSVGFILEEGTPMEDFWRIVQSMRAAVDEAGVQLVTGDTKVLIVARPIRFSLTRPASGWCRKVSTFIRRARGRGTGSSLVDRSQCTASPSCRFARDWNLKRRSPVIRRAQRLGQ